MRSGTLWRLFVAFMVLYGMGVALTWSDLPGRIPMHFGLDGEADRWTERAGLVWFGLPALAAVLGVFIRTLGRFAARNPKIWWVHGRVGRRGRRDPDRGLPPEPADRPADPGGGAHGVAGRARLGCSLRLRLRLRLRIRFRSGGAARQLCRSTPPARRGAETPTPLRDMRLRSSRVASATVASSTSVLAVLVLISLPVSLEAQHEHAPYAGEQVRAIKALSPEAIEGLRAGEGMGYALAAELNGYPGPRHVLDLGEMLGLSAEQRRRVEEVRSRMREAAVDLGERLVAAERALDRAFASGEVTPADVERLTGVNAAIEGRLRAVHLEAHLETRALLTEEQVEDYGRLRGYGYDHDPGESHP